MSSIISRLQSYSNPIVVFSSLCLLIYFSRINFSSSIVNRIAASCFAAYLLHCNPNIYSLFVKSVGDMVLYNTFIELRILGIVCVWFILSILLDSLRVSLWNLTLKIQDVIIMQRAKC